MSDLKRLDPAYKLDSHLGLDLNFVISKNERKIGFHLKHSSPSTHPPFSSFINGSDGFGD